jgi:hypothetical protein
MERREFIKKGTILTSAVAISPLFMFSKCEKDIENFTKEILVDVGLSVLQLCTFTACTAIVKNPQICGAVSEAISVATEIAINSSKNHKKGNTYVDNKKIDWEVSRRSNKYARIKFAMDTLGYLIDIQKTLGCKDGRCEEFEWDYIGLYGVGNFPETAFRELSSNEILSLDTFDRCIMRNEMFARHGYRFNNNYDVINYFNKQDWYNNFPDTLKRNDNDWGSHVKSNYFNNYEIYNLNLIRQLGNDKC